MKPEFNNNMFDHSKDRINEATGVDVDGLKERETDLALSFAKNDYKPRFSHLAADLLQTFTQKEMAVMLGFHIRMHIKECLEKQAKNKIADLFSEILADVKKDMKERENETN